MRGSACYPMIHPSSILRRSLGVVASALLVAGGASVHAAGDGPDHRFGASRPIPGRYIVMLRDDTADADAESQAVSRRHGGARERVFNHAFKGFSGSIPDSEVEALRRDAAVTLVEQDHTISLNTIEANATWGLDRIDQVDRPLGNTYVYNRTGAGVTAFIVDTGILSTHTEFAGRVLPGFTAIGDGRGTTDCNGHGTHVSGTVGGITYGVAKAVKLVPVRVLDCNGSGTWSGVIAGLDYVAKSTVRPAVANMSLGGGFSTTVNAAVAKAVAAGVTVAVAAGNDNVNACSESPSSEPTALTVGAVTNTSDARATFSNWGSCVKVFAPGVGVTSAWNTSTTATNTISGTSMASPHVAGVAALILEATPSASPAAVSAFIVSRATPNHVTGAGTGSPNLLLYSLGTGVPTEPVIPTIAVKSLASSTAFDSRNWQATVTITVRDVNTQALMPNVTVTGAFAPGTTVSCVTGSTGACSVLGALWSRRSVSSATYTLTALAGSRMVYDATQNAASRLQINAPASIFGR